MNRRTLLRVLILTALASPLAARAQHAGKVYRVGVLIGPPALSSPTIEAFRQGLAELGWSEGQNIVIEYRWDHGSPDRLTEVATDLVRTGVDIIVTSGPDRIRAAQRAAPSTPIVMAVVHEPVAFGFVATFARPGGNLTGLAFQDSDLSTKRLQLLREEFPRMSRVALLWDRIGGGEAALRATETAARLMGLEIVTTEVSGPNDFGRAVASVRRSRAEAILQLASPFFNTHRQAIADLALQHRLPTSCETRLFVESGCLMSYGPDFRDMYRRAAAFVDKILKGAKPADLPVEQPTKFELVINLKTAKALGLTIPQSLLLRADQVIE